MNTSPKKRDDDMMAWGDEEISNSSFQHNTEMELLRLSQRIKDLDKKITDEALLIKEAMSRSNKEQQFYIETLHQDLEIVEKNRLKRYKEEEAERARLMEDVIRLYEKMKH